VGATIHQTDILCKPLKPQVDAEGFFESCDNVYKFIQGMLYKKTVYRNIFYHLQEAVHCENPHLFDSDKQVAPNYYAHGLFWYKRI
jgi:hypothetical protein